MLGCETGRTRSCWVQLSSLGQLWAPPSATFCHIYIRAYYFCSFSSVLFLWGVFFFQFCIKTVLYPQSFSHFNPSTCLFYSKSNMTSKLRMLASVVSWNKPLGCLYQAGANHVQQKKKRERKKRKPFFFLFDAISSTSQSDSQPARHACGCQWKRNKEKRSCCCRFCLKAR